MLSKAIFGKLMILDCQSSQESFLNMRFQESLRAEKKILLNFY